MYLILIITGILINIEVFWKPRLDRLVNGQIVLWYNHRAFDTVTRQYLQLW